MIKVFYFTCSILNGKFQCYDINNNAIEAPVSEKKLKKAYAEGFMAMVVTEKNGKKRCKKISRDLIDAPWHTKDKQIWEDYRMKQYEKIRRN